MATLLLTCRTPDNASMYRWQLAVPEAEQRLVQTHLLPAGPKQCSTCRLACSAFMPSALEQVPLGKAGCAMLHGARLVLHYSKPSAPLSAWCWQ